MTKAKLKPAEEYIYEAAEYWKLTESIKHLWTAGEFGDARELEAQLIERLIRDISWQYEDPRAEALVDLFNHEGRR